MNFRTSSRARIALQEHGDHAFSDRLVLRRVDERIHTDIQEDEEHGGVVDRRSVLHVVADGLQKEEDLVRKPADDECHRDRDHRRHDVHLTPMGVRLKSVRHVLVRIGSLKHPALFSDDVENAPVEVDEEQEGQDKLPEYGENGEQDGGRRVVGPVIVGVALSARHRAGPSHHGVNDDPTDPGESNSYVCHPFPEILTMDDQMNDLQIPLYRNEDQVHYGSGLQEVDDRVAGKNDAYEVTPTAVQIDERYLDGVASDQRQTGEEIQQNLVDDEDVRCFGSQFL